MNKQVNIRIAGQDRFETVEVTPKMTANDVKAKAGCPLDYDLSPTVGEPPFGNDEEVFPRIKDGGKIIASPAADAGI